MDDINKLLEITKSIIESPTSISNDGASRIAMIERNYSGSFPVDIRKFLVGVPDLPQNAQDIFSGYEPLTLDMIAEEYINLPNGRFFSAFSMDSNCIASEDLRLRIWKSLDGEVEGDPEMSDMRRIVPLFNGGAGFYICLFHNDVGDSELAIVTQDFYICSYAPSLTEHIENIEDGLARNIYRTLEGDSIMPTDWYKRVKAISPEGLPVCEWNS